MTLTTLYLKSSLEIKGFVLFTNCPRTFGGDYIFDHSLMKFSILLSISNNFVDPYTFTAKVALMHPKKIVQSKLRRRLAKAASELGLHYFLFHLAKTHAFTNIVDL